jgi:hypothetical protein
MTLRSEKIVGLKVMEKSITGLIKVIFGNSLMERNWYYPHNIDLMHHESNIVESIISMCFDVGFSKDNMNARKDLAALCNRPSLEAKTNAKENLTRPSAPYYLKPIKRK